MRSRHFCEVWNLQALIVAHRCLQLLADDLPETLCAWADYPRPQLCMYPAVLLLCRQQHHYLELVHVEDRTRRDLNVSMVNLVDLSVEDCEVVPSSGLACANDVWASVICSYDAPLQVGDGASFAYVPPLRCERDARHSFAAAPLKLLHDVHLHLLED